MIKNNSSINFTSRDAFFKPAKKEPAVKEEPKAEEIQNADEEEEDNSFEATQKRAEAADRAVMRNTLMGALMGLSMLSAPFALSAFDEPDYMSYGSSVPYVQPPTDEEKATVEFAKIIAKAGKDSTVLERREFEGLLDYSQLEGLPKSIRESMKINARIGFTPVDMKKPNAEQELLKQLRASQRSINTQAENYKKNPPKSSRQLYYEYAMKYVTDREILDQVDFSELSIYQHDMTVLRHLIASSRDKIERNDMKAEEKKAKQIEDAQKLVNNIVQKYKMKAKVQGNYDGNDVLTKGELASTLDMSVLKGLPDEWQMRIIAKAVEQYKPMDVRYATDQRQVDRTNEKVDVEKEKAQKELDKWAVKAQREYFRMTHPNLLLGPNAEGMYIYNQSAVQ